MVPASDAVSGALWWALRNGTLLAGTHLPDDAFDFAAMAARGLTQLISLTGELHPAHSPLIGTAFALQDLHGEAEPADPAGELERVGQAATYIRDLLDQGEGVLVHCLGGTGRTGTVIGAVLVSLGHSANDVAAWLNEVHQQRGQPGWPECPWQRDALTTLI